MAYIDSEMAKRRLGQGQVAEAQESTNNSSKGDSQQSAEVEISRSQSAAKPALERQPASLGKIHEIDLGAASTLRNAERTESALRRAVNGERR